MSLPAAARAGAAKETGPRLEAEDWARVAAAPVQPHLGDFMIGTPAGLENTQRALAAGSPRSATSASTSRSSRPAATTTPR